MLSQDIRSRAPKAPMTQIRLQGKLWDVFADKEGEVTQLHQPQQIWDHTQGKMIPNPEYNIMKFLDIKNKSKICVYKFNAEAGQGHIQLPGQHWHQWGNLQKIYSIILIPAKDQNPEPQDKSYDEVPNQLAEEIEGEGFKVPDANNPEESRKAVHEEMRQRLARRSFEDNQTRRLHRFQNEERLHHHKNLGLPHESIYLSPSDIKDQTYGRVHIPDHRYGRVHERLYAIERAQVATHQEMEQAERNLKNEEVHSASARGGVNGQWGRVKKSEEDVDLDYSNTAKKGFAKSGKYSQYYQERGMNPDGDQNKNLNYQE